MRSYLFFTFFLFTFSSLQAQTNWSKGWETELTENAVWDADQAGNVYLYDKEVIRKIDTTGVTRLTQSAKSFGNIRKIDASNWLKIAVFSEEQQTVCYLDNALAIQPNCIELAEKGVMLAVNFSTSIQTDRIWIYDQLNSQLQLITLRSNQGQIVQNLRSLIDLGNVEQLFEYQNVLYIADDAGQVALFDNFGSFVSGITYNGTYIQPYAKGMLFINGNTIIARNNDSEKEVTFYAATESEGGKVTKFHFTGKYLYLQQNRRLICMKLV